MAPDPSSEDVAAAERALLELPELELLGLLHRSSNYTFLARLSGGAGDLPAELLAVYKPADGESPLWDFPAGTLYRREVASYRLARALGWPRIPATVVRERAPHGVGALQLFVEADQKRHYLSSGGKPEREWLQVAVFDAITNNADRKSGHCLFDAEGRIWVIDHGLTFHTDVKLRTVIWDFAGRELPAALRADLRRAAAGLEAGDLRAELEELLSRAELEMLRRRLRAAAGAGWRLPEPRSAWSVPWPPV